MFGPINFWRICGIIGSNFSTHLVTVGYNFSLKEFRNNAYVVCGQVHAFSLDEVFVDTVKS